MDCLICDVKVAERDFVYVEGYPIHQDCLREWYVLSIAERMNLLDQYRRLLAARGE